MAGRIALFSEKGGVGKTTLAINIAAALALAGKRVLLCDCDQQGNASNLLLDLGPNSGDAGPDMSDVLLGECEPDAAIRQTALPGLSIIPAGDRLADTQVELVNLPGRDLRLRQALAELGHRFDCIAIDCPPGRGLLAVLALAASDRIILPLDPSRGGLSGIQRGMDLVAQVRRFVPDPARPGAPAIAGIVLNRVQKNRTHQECLDNLTTAYGAMLLGVIPAGVAIDSAGWAAKPVVLSDPESAPAKAITKLAGGLTDGKFAAA